MHPFDAMQVMADSPLTYFNVLKCSVDLSIYQIIRQLADNYQWLMFQISIYKYKMLSEEHHLCSKKLGTVPHVRRTSAQIM